MPASASSADPQLRLGVAVMLALWAAVLGRTLSLAYAGQWLWYLAGFAGFLAILLTVVLRRGLPEPLRHVAFAVQAAIVLVLLAVDPRRDFVTVLLVVQCYQAALVFPPTSRTFWMAMLVTLIGFSLVVELGPVQGLSGGLVTMAGGVVLSMYAVVTRELQEQRRVSERMVDDLRAARERLLANAGHADELAAIEQRARVAGDLERSVTGKLEGVLAASAAARGRLGEPSAAALDIERLQELTAEALAQMRRIITELRPPADS